MQLNFAFIKSFHVQFPKMLARESFSSFFLIICTYFVCALSWTQVVYTLRRVMTASTVPVIRTFSPALSASPGSSIMESSGSASDDRSSSTQDRTPSVHSMGIVTGRLRLSTLMQEASSSASVPRRKALDRKSTLAGQRDR